MTDRPRKVYRGYREPGDKARILVTWTNTHGENEQYLQRTRRFSPIGFEWGFMGNGARDTAHALLTHHFGGDIVAFQKADRLFEAFADHAVSTLSYASWEYDTEAIDEALRVIARRSEEAPAAIVANL